jgi:SRSO17 transposase
MLGVVDDARTAALAGHAAWSESFNEMFMQAAGLDHYQVRKYRAWYRRVTLAMLAHAFLAATARAARPGTASGNGRAVPAEKGA